MDPSDSNDALPGRPLPDDLELSLPGYQLLRILGKGGMGIVYLGLQTSLNRWVAIKSIVPEAGPRQENTKRLRREAEALSSMQHRNIVGCLDLIEQDGMLYLVMEYVHGWYSVRDLCRRYGHVDQAYAVRIGLQAARALDCAHRHHVLHRDIKPANILIYHEFDGPPPPIYQLFSHPATKIMICDFGLTKTTQPGTDLTRLTQDGTTVGSPVYMAPEQARADKIDFRTDMYALGTTMFQLLTATTPFQANSRIEALQLKVSMEKFPSPADYGFKVSRDLERIIRRMTMYSPELRYPSYDQLIPELEELARKLKPPAPDDAEAGGLTGIFTRLRRRFGQG